MSSPNVFVESVKLAEDRSGDVILRLYEACGSRAIDVNIAFGFDAAVVWTTDLLERPDGPDVDCGLTVDGFSIGEGSSVTLSMRPFEIITLRSQNQT